MRARYYDIISCQYYCSTSRTYHAVVQTTVVVKQASSRVHEQIQNHTKCVLFVGVSIRGFRSYPYAQTRYGRLRPHGMPKGSTCWCLRYIANVFDCTTDSSTELLLLLLLSLYGRSISVHDTLGVVCSISFGFLPLEWLVRKGQESLPLLAQQQPLPFSLRRRSKHSKRQEEEEKNRGLSPVLESVLREKQVLPILRAVRKLGAISSPKKSHGPRRIYPSVRDSYRNSASALRSHPELTPSY